MNYKGMIVDVYYNLHKKKFSIRYNGKVVAHMDTVYLKCATFHVQERGRQRVLRERRKNVHAYVRGEIAEFDVASNRRMYIARYSPYMFPYFFNEETQQPVYIATEVLLHNKKIMYRRDIVNVS